METLWFVLVAFMLVGYAVLDGFDLGAGFVHLFAARPGMERRLVLAVVGPVWDGNEVWLLAAGGVLYLAFPALYASSFSGFYLPLTIVLWLLILRGIGIEFRSHIENSLWQSFFDVIFSLSSMLLAVIFGAAVGNVIRGVPLDSRGYFFEPLWTTFTIEEHPGILDWYTVTTGLLALVALTGHGARYIALKTEGDLSRRSRRVAALFWYGTSALTILGLLATLNVRPQVLDNYAAYPVGIILPGAVFAGLAAMAHYHARGKDKAAFVSSSLYIAGMLGSAGFAIYPDLLPATTDPAYSLTVHNTAASRYELWVALAWWIPGMILVLGYFVCVYRFFRGKVQVE